MKGKKLKTGIKKFFSVIIAVAMIMTGVFAQTEIASAAVYDWMGSAHKLQLNQSYEESLGLDLIEGTPHRIFYIYLPANMNVRLTTWVKGSTYFSGINIYNSSGKRVKAIGNSDGWKYNYDAKKSVYTKKISLRKGGYYIDLEDYFYDILSKTYGIKTTVSLASTTRITGLRKLSGRNLKLAWKRMSGVSGYEVFRSTSKYGTYRKVATVSGIVYVNRNLTRNRTYYYKVRAFKKIGGKKYYAPSSAAKGIRM